MPKLEIPDTLDTLDGVEEKYRSLYVKNDGGDGFVYKDPKAAIEGMRHAKAERGELAERLKEYESKYKDVDPEKYRSLIGKEKEFEQIDQTNKGELDKIKSELREKYEGQISERDKKILERDSRYANRILTDQISRALAKAGATDKGAEVLARVLKGEITTKMGDDGEPEFVILDSKTKKQRLNDSADPFTIEDLIAEQRNELPQLFGSGGGSGSGAGQGDKGAAVPSDDKPSTWNQAQKKAYINANGHKAFQALLVKEGQEKDRARRDGGRKIA